MTIAAQNLFLGPIMNPNSCHGLNKIDDKRFYGSAYYGFSFRPDVLCDLDGKLRNWRKGLRLKIFELS